MKIPIELEKILNLQKRKDAKHRIIKVYDALLYKRGKTKGYFQCPSAYLKKISPRYNKVMKLLLDSKIIDYQSFNEEQIDIFNARRKKFYNTENGTCIRYKFIIDTETGYEYDYTRRNTNLYDKEKWYIKTRRSLLQLGFGPEEIHISFFV